MQNDKATFEKGDLLFLVSHSKNIQQWAEMALIKGLASEEKERAIKMVKLYVHEVAINYDQKFIDLSINPKADE